MIGYGSKAQISATLNGLGFTCNDFSVNGNSYSCINKAAEREQVNYFISHRNIIINGEAQTLIFAGFIGSHLEQWYSNFDPGTGDTHKGFQNAKNYVYNIINQYISYLNLDYSKAKILVTGHSRGAATANLVAAQLIKDNNFACENVYAYTFATPNVTTLSEREDAKFKRIYNIVNPEDFVTKCLPAAWGYGRYGTTLTLPSKTNSYTYKQYLSTMQEYFTMFYGGKKYSPYSNGEEATYNVANALTSNVKNIDEFYNKKFNWLGGKTTIQEFFMETLCAFVGEKDGSQKKDEAQSLFINTLLKVNESSSVINYITFYFVTKEGLGTVANNANWKYFTYGHCAQTYSAYMMSLNESQIQNYRAGLHNSVNCPVDVEIIDKQTGEVVGKIVNNVIDEEIAVKDDAVVMTVDGDSKQFWLPADGYYDIVLTGNDEGTMDYSVSEIDSDYGELKRSNFFDIDISEASSMTGIPEVEEASLNNYNLDIGNDETIENTTILETEDLSGVKIETASFGKGFASESMTVSAGDYINLTAFENEKLEDNSFIGWYINDELYSTEASISFVAKEDIVLEAEFTRFMGDSNGDNVINSSDALDALRFATDTIEFNQFEFAGTDVNGDGDVDSLDALMILQYCVGLITEFEYIEE